jgi:hypothetical protein
MDASDGAFLDLIKNILKDNLEIEIWGDRHEVEVSVYFQGEPVASDKHRY